MGTLLVAVIALFVGWNFPQPQFAKDFQDKIFGWFNK